MPALSENRKVSEKLTVMTHCPTCGREVSQRKKTGRPKSYCSTSCRRSAALEVTRLQRRLTKLEDGLSKAKRDAERGYSFGARVDVFGRGPQLALADLLADIAEARRRLKSLVEI